MQGMRAFGVLLPISSLPDSPLLGDLGPPAYAFCQWLKDAGASFWQVLPLCPLGPGDSPYAAPSTFAGNPLLISPQLLLEEGFLQPQDLADAPPAQRWAAYEGMAWRWQLLKRAFCAFQEKGLLAEDFALFCQNHQDWLEDWALFSVASQLYGSPFWTWPAPLAHHQPEALAQLAKAQPQALEEARFYQFLFFRQWEKLRQAAFPVQIFGDLPFFVAAHSADVWSQPHLFKLRKDLRPRVVAGVPPDYFSPEGQLWGNPVYNWEAHEAEGFAWWLRRLHHALRLFDLVRLDHFRAFVAAWEVPADHAHARQGQWVAAPGRELLQSLGQHHRLVAEDLGFITPDVVALREELGLPGMAVLQFAFDPSQRSSFLPHNHRENLVVYTGTHDNNTTQGWWEEEASRPQQEFFRAYTALQEPIHQAMVRLAMASVARLAIIPVQDVLGLPSSCRLNRPGSSQGNWRFRLLSQELTQEHAQWLRQLAELYQRLPAPSPSGESLGQNTSGSKP
jgi:4-alpha-glucanotransferase